MSFSSGVSKSARSIPASANAWSVGANTVKGPVPSRVDTRFACAKAATRESCTPVPAALVGISSLASALTFSGIADATKIVIIMNVRTLFINYIRFSWGYKRMFFFTKSNILVSLYIHVIGITR